MKKRDLALFALGALSALAVGAFAQQQGNAPRVSSFAIELTVDRANNGVRMKCLDGCGWKTLGFSCGADKPDCVASFNEYGTPAR